MTMYPFILLPFYQVSRVKYPGDLKILNDTCM